MRSGLTKLTGVLAGALLLAGVIVPATTSAAAPPTSHKVAETGCGTNGDVSGTSTTSTGRGVTTTVTKYGGEISTTVIVPVGTPDTRARFMASDEAGNEYFAITPARANAAATAFNRANPTRAIGNGVVYYARTKFLAEAHAMISKGYVNGVPVTSTPQYLATSRNGTAFWSSCSQARANALASLDTNRAPKKVWHATNTSTGQHVTSAVSAKAATALAAYHYEGYTPGEVAAYGFNCQVLTAMSNTGLITALQAQMAAMPYSAYGGDFLGYDTTGANPADMQMFRGVTQTKANALATAFGKSLVRGGVFVVGSGACASVGPSIKEVVAIQNIEPNDFLITPTSILDNFVVNQLVVVNANTGLQTIQGADINVGGHLVTLDAFVQATPTPTPATWDTNNGGVGSFNAAVNMAAYDSGSAAAADPPQASQELTTPYMPTHAKLPTHPITCTPIASNWAVVPPITMLSFDCPIYYHQSAP